MDWLRYVEYDDRIALLVPTYRCVPSYSSFFNEVLGISIHYTAFGVNWTDTTFWMPSKGTIHIVHLVETSSRALLVHSLAGVQLWEFLQ